MAGESTSSGRDRLLILLVVASLSAVGGLSLLPPRPAPPPSMPSPPETVRPAERLDARIRWRRAAAALAVAEQEADRLQAALETEKKRTLQTEAERQAGRETTARLQKELDAAVENRRTARTAFDAARAEAEKQGIIHPKTASPAPPPVNPADAQPSPEQIKSAADGEAALQLDDEARRRIQTALTAMGFDTRGIDGIIGPRTREMIAAWQKQRSEPNTGYLTSAQKTTLIDKAASMGQ
jgi:hypothetical protein